jgi:hypothetical protein
METANPQSIWCLIANVTREPHPEGPDGELRLGTRHFAPGAKLYCFPNQWGDGGEKLRVLGRHRGGGPKLIEMIVATKWLTNWRVQEVFHPHVVHAMKAHSRGWNNTEDSRETAGKMAASYSSRDC